MLQTSTQHRTASLCRKIAAKFTPSRASVLTLVAAAALVTTAPPAAQAATPVLTLGSPVTDNYKASYNANPGVRELRTWLATKSVSVGAVTFKPVPPATGMAYVGAQDGLAVRGSDGSSAVLTAATTSTNTLGQGFFRTAPTGEFGLLMQHKSVTALQTAPIRETLTLTRAGVVLASATVDYTYDRVIATVAPGHIEYNGPSGRWFVAGTATRLDWESSAPAPAPAPAPAGPDTTAPVLGSVVLPASTVTRAITIKLSATDNVAVSEVRFANENGVWTAWQPFAAQKQWTLSAGAGFKGVFAQVRDAARNESKSIYTRTTCNAPCS